MQMCNHKRDSGFSLIELVIVVVIIGIIGAIAIPRMSRGTEGAADSALKANLTVLQNALDLYAAEHNGDYPTLANLPDALLKRTNASGEIDDGSEGPFIYGPYLRSVPPLPVGPHRGNTNFTATADTEGAGWVYSASTGRISANVPENLRDEAGTLYADY